MVITHQAFEVKPILCYLSLPSLFYLCVCIIPLIILFSVELRWNWMSWSDFIQFALHNTINFVWDSEFPDYFAMKIKVIVFSYMGQLNKQTSDPKQTSLQSDTCFQKKLFSLPKQRSSTNYIKRKASRSCWVKIIYRSCRGCQSNMFWHSLASFKDSWNSFHRDEHFRA